MTRTEIHIGDIIRKIGTTQTLIVRRTTYVHGRRSSVCVSNTKDRAAFFYLRPDELENYEKVER